MDHTLGELPLPDGLEGRAYPAGKFTEVYTEEALRALNWPPSDSGGLPAGEPVLEEFLQGGGMEVEQRLWQAPPPEGPKILGA